MAQTFVDDIYSSGRVADTTMGWLEANFAALMSSYSGAGNPPNTIAGLQYYDTVKKVLKVRRATNDSFYYQWVADALQKIWKYRNDAVEGWAIDSSVTDRVTAIKGGVQAYNANGGTVGGTWTQPDCTLTVAQSPAHTHGAGATHTHSLPNRQAFYTWDPQGDGGLVGSIHWGIIDQTLYTELDGAHEHDSVGGGLPHHHGDTARYYAAVGTLQYLDI